MISFENFIKIINLYTPENFRFKCLDCGDCCRHESGYVFLLEREIKKMSKKLQLSNDSFKDNFLFKFSEEVYSLKEKGNFDCVFWDNNTRRGKGGCSIYKIRPLQCQNFPFWISTFSSKDNFIEQCKRCKGLMNKNGKVYPRLQIYKYVYQDLINREVHYKSFLSKEVCEILSIK